ncbi:P-loop containing nucleoside triphosphate hydrolase protein [Staphylotrichum tortipilum]|uniref:P-loop containing nucleoside triphosphate hydrolase protein n=1 Tax=Staphylotrichum tortipilum TaxID=2831512 RepID=A0AAN6MU28_9PEZI|nr:P-loop containing nucleoside triphosphate hydrolase protein [Staphylotrichum longicolle]
MEKASALSASTQKATNLFQVYLRLRPPQNEAAASSEPFLAVEEPDDDITTPRHITLNPPNDRRRAIEKFAFTQVFEEDATQLDIFHCTGVANLVKGVLAPCGGDGTDALLATLGVTGSGKSHTILGSKSQRGLTQLALDVIFRSIGQNVVDCDAQPVLEHSIAASDPSEAAIFQASTFLDTVYADPPPSFRASSRAPTPMHVGLPGTPTSCLQGHRQEHRGPSGPGLALQRSMNVRIVSREDSVAPSTPPSAPGLGCRSPSKCKASSRGRRGNALPRSIARGGGQSPSGPYHQQVRTGHRVPQGQQPVKHFMAPTASIRFKTGTKTASQGDSIGPGQTPSRRLHRPSAFPQQPDVSALSMSCDPSAEYAVLVSMYEVYNDRIFDLLTPAVKSATTKEYRRRPLLFKSTEASPDRKVVAGLRKVICGTLHQALMVLEAGLHERRVTGTGSNSVSSRSHGFFCVEVKKRTKGGSRRHGAEAPWSGSALTVVDLAGSERARDAKTAGATLAEAGKINESLMYLGQCLQMQSDAASKDKCKLTELLFSNCYPSPAAYASGRYRNPQKAVMIVTADPHGDFNATSQILRYSALAREVTVPRVPSITQTILAAAAAAALQAPQPGSSPPLASPTFSSSRPFSPASGPVRSPQLLSSPNIMRNTSPPTISSSPPGSGDMHRSTMEAAALEIARLSEEVDYLRRAADAERAAREEAEAHLLSMEDRMVELEQAIREDCTNEFERRLEIEMARWRATMQVEMERGEEHWGRKIEVFERSMDVRQQQAGGGCGSDDGCWSGDEDKENVLVEDVNQENERLRRENEALRREVAGMSPAKRMPLQERGSDVGMALRSKQPPPPGETGSPRPARKTRGAAAGAAAGEEDSLLMRMEKLRVSDAQASARGTAAGGASPKKVRKLPAKRWNAVDNDDDLF